MTLKAENTKSLSTQRLAVLISGDLLVMLALIWWGRSEHALPATDIRGGLFTAAPFVIGWFLVTPWFGLFQAGVSQTWQKLVPRLLLAWAIGGSLALVLRSLVLDRPIIPIFALVMLGTTMPAMLLWRLAYAWLAGRYNPDEDTEFRHQPLPAALVAFGQQIGRVDKYGRRIRTGKAGVYRSGRAVAARAGLAYLGPGGGTCCGYGAGRTGGHPGYTPTILDRSRSVYCRLFRAACPGLGGDNFGDGLALEKHLQAEREAEAQTCLIRLDQQAGQLSYQTTARSQEETLAYGHIHQARTTHAIGGRGHATRLVIETDQGTLVLLGEALGTTAQKIDLAREIQSVLDSYPAG